MDKFSVIYDTLYLTTHPEEEARTGKYVDYGREFQYVSLMMKYAHDSREIDALRARIAQLEAQAHEETGEAVEGSITRLPVPVKAHTRFL